MFTKNENYIAQKGENPLIWVAEYEDFSYIDERTHELTDIDKSKLIRFGLVADETKMYFEVYSGIFKIAGRMIHVNYRVGDTVYPLVGRLENYNDIVAYKGAEFYINLEYLNGNLKDFKPEVKPNITQFAFGHKSKSLIKGVTFSTSIVCENLYDGRTQLHFIIQTDKTMDGRLEIFKNGNLIDSYLAPLPAYEGREMIWQVK